MKVYNKLVRDKVPDIISAKGITCDFRMLTDAEYLLALDEKLDEELAEYHASHDVEELADLMEVIYAIAVARGMPTLQLDNIRYEKAVKRGRFLKKIMLLSVMEGDDG